MARRVALARLFAGYGMVLGLTAATAALMLVHGGRVLNFGFPLMATAVAGALFTVRRSVYAAFVWWIWLFTPLVRRLVDYQTVYHNISPVMATPLLVTGFSLVALLSRPRFLLRRSMWPFFLLLLVISYALLVGIITNGFLSALFEFANWLLPVVFAIHLMMFPKEYSETKTALIFAITSGLLLISVYGLYQFYRMPPWDAYWINASQFDTAGQAYAEEVRVFSTLNSPGPYGVILMGSLVFVMVTKGPLRLVAGAFGLPSFGLSLVRSAWGGLVIAALFVVWRVGGKTRLRIIAAGMLVALVAVPLMTAGPVADALSQRFASLQNVQNDESFEARESLYESLTTAAISEPIGVGFGQLGVATKLTSGNAVIFDSGLLQIPLEFGWVGGASFVWAIGALLLRALNATNQTNDRIAIAGGGLFIASLTQNIFSSSFGGVMGMVLWVGLALALGPTLSRTVEPTVVGQAFQSNGQLV